ncbi:hypothetical protein PCASD_15369 [Puccinia coronata f. sp. avenae]|uniref:Uncharacterized protein n=1 Tax=Puccinia coronata f. sp. avenae TaxID=200324 RepID=A0A2N5S220_9BASI|nr:hypothetical protein PCASD_23332 [Puccinia coronata f. sp. avenae]PLW26861.1 hypothetical protein PCASD_25107 [Puccinia coronata f. sp. avenae]PLW37221.1 hypothetical protein PCASD_15369 [Puccinia coronata f. sp. avenae]
MQSDSCQASRIGELKYPVGSAAGSWFIPGHLIIIIKSSLSLSASSQNRTHNQPRLKGTLEKTEQPNPRARFLRREAEQRRTQQRLFFVLLISAIAPPRHFQRSTLKLNWHPHQIDRK